MEGNAIGEVVVNAYDECMMVTAQETDRSDLMVGCDSLGLDVLRAVVVQGGREYCGGCSSTSSWNLCCHRRPRVAFTGRPNVHFGQKQTQLCQQNQIVP